MQKLPGIIKIENGKGKWCDINGTPGAIPRITLALAAQLVIDLRSSRFALPEKPDLAPYPFDEVAGSASFYVAVDSDYDQLTIPPIIRTSGINAAQDADGATVLTVALPLLDSPELRDAVKTGAEVLLKAEIGGLNADGQTVFVVQFPLILQNRVYIPDGSGSPETPDPSDPEYLTTTQVKAYINTELAAAVAALELPVGETGPAPIITIGSVEEGEDAAAAIVPVGEGAYAINLTLPRATDGETPEPITPQIAIGTIQSGDAAAATLTPVIGTPGAFTLNLTLPRGADGAGVTPRGQWAAETSYNQHDAVRHASAWWRSLHGDNLGNEPPATRIDDAHWEIIVKDGTSADPLVVTYNDTDNPNDPDWHLHRRATDKYYRWTTDGGRTFTEAALLTQAAIAPILRFNQDATTDWRNLPAAAGTNNYHSVIGKYYRLKTDSGVWGEAKQVHNLDASEVYRVQFGATPPEGAIDPDTGAPLEPDWHANFLPGDDRIIFYNLSGTIRLDVKVTLPEGEEIGGVQFCAIADPWHADYAEGDRFWKISIDGGATYSQPIPLYGKSTYEEWLAAGNTGTPEEFLDSLKGKDGDDGAPGEGLRIDQADTFERRHLCDSAPQGFIFLATDILVDDAGREYQAFYIKRTVAQGDWSDPVRLYPGSPGKTGAAGTVDIGEVSAGIAPEVRNSGTPSAAVLDFVLPVGPPGPGAVPVPDYEFTHADIVGGGLTISGVNPIAAVELYDAEGNGISIERGDAAGTDKCMVRTCYPENHTVVYFGTGLDTTHGGRVRFAQGLSGASLFQIWKANYGNESSTEADYLEWLRGQNSWLDFTDADVTDGVAFLPVTVPVVSVVTSNGNCYPVEKGSLTPAVGGWNLNLAPYLAYDNAPAFAGTWKAGLAAGTVASVVIHQGSAPNGVYQPCLANGNLHYLSLTRDTTILAPVRLRSNETLAVEVLTNRHYVTVKGKRFSGTRLLVTFWQGFAGARATVDSIL